MRRLLTILSIASLAISWPALGQMIIEGEGVVSTRPDLFSIEVEIATYSETSGEAWVSLAEKIKTLYDAVSDAGVKRDHFQVGRVRLGEASTGLAGSAKIVIVVPAGDENDQLLDTIQRLPGIQIGSFRYRSSRGNELRMEAKALAVANAIRQLDELARSAGGRRGAVRSINRGPESDVEEIVVTGSGYRNDTSARRVPVSQGLLRFEENVWVTADFIEGE